jgi:uncharacterized protein (TIGR00645 family)
MSNLNRHPQKLSASGFFEWIIFTSRWILAPMYLGLIAAELVYAFKFCQELIDMCTHLLTLTEEEMLIGLLGLVDFTMVANLVVMIVMGGYSIFIRRMVVSREERPQWLDHVDSTTLKIKMGMSLIGVSSIHLLKTFIDADKANWHTLSMQLSIHGMFVLSTIAMAVIYRISHDKDQWAHTPTMPNGHEGDHSSTTDQAGNGAPAHEDGARLQPGHSSH